MAGGEMVSQRVTFNVASDYAVLKAGECRFYYGYEFDQTKEENGESWGFEYTLAGESVVRWTFNELAAQAHGTSDVFNTTDCLLAGIGLVLATGAPPRGERWT